MPKVTITQARGINMATRQVQLHSYYNVHLEGLGNVAVVGWDSDSKVLFTRTNISPIDKQIVMDEVEKALSLVDSTWVEPHDIQAQLDADTDDNDDEEFVNVSY